MKIIKKLSAYIGSYKKSALLSPILVMLEVIMECAIPAIAGTLINELNQSKGNINLGRVAIFCTVLICCALLSLMFGALAGIQCSKASCGFAKNLRTALYNRSQDFSFENIDKFSTSSLVTRLTTDVTNVQQSFMMIIRTAIRSPLMFIFSILMAFIRGGSMALIFVIVIPVFLFFLFHLVQFFRVLFEYQNVKNRIKYEQERGRTEDLLAEQQRKDAETKAQERAAMEAELREKLKAELMASMAAEAKAAETPAEETPTEETPEESETPADADGTNAEVSENPVVEQPVEEQPIVEQPVEEQPEEEEEQSEETPAEEEIV